ncbi:MAG TPA: copper resistance CopC family protein [Nitrospirota bacterium]|nr:copper resistance CopC family protein [Nitrospirota bacterium]
MNISRSSDAWKAAVLLILVFLFIMPGVARGHAYPDHAEPKVGATVTTPPAVVRIWFDSDLEPVFSSIMVHAAKDDVMVDKRDGRVDKSDPKLLEVSVPTLPPGEYIVYWNVVARDGHRTSGNYRFKIK